MAKLDKPIIHFRLPLNERGDIVCNAPLAFAFLGGIKELLGEKAYVIASTCDIDVISAEVEKVKVDEITLEEFLKKHDIKDGAGE